MGSCFGWRSKREVVDMLRKECSPYRELDFALVKDHGHDSILYRLLLDPATGEKIITIDLVYAARGRYGAGYKSMTEAMGFGEANCPARIILGAGDPPNQYAREWRKKCLRNAKK